MSAFVVVVYDEAAAMLRITDTVLWSRVPQRRARASAAVASFLCVTVLTGRWNAFATPQRTWR